MTKQKRNTENKGLAPRWIYYHNAYFYRPRKDEKHLFDGKSWFMLGKTLSEAHLTFAGRMDFSGVVERFNQLGHRYSMEVLPGKAAATVKSQARCMKRLVAVFGEVQIQAIESHHIYEYRDKVGTKLGKKTANLDLELLSHMFTKSIQWGARKGHPMTNMQVTKFTLKHRTRYVEDWELEAVMSVASPTIKSYLILKGLTGLDKGDLMSIRSAGVGKDRLTVDARKKTRSSRNTARQRYFPYVDSEGKTTGIREAIDSIKAIHGRPDITTHLFCAIRNPNKGKPYINEKGETSGFDSIWQRTMKKALKETDLAIKFTEHDLRAKVASDSDSDEEAQKQLDNTSVSMTRKVYRRKAIEMPVAKGFKNS